MQRAKMIFYDTVDWNDSAAKMHETRLRSVTRFNEMNRIKMEKTLNYKNKKTTDIVIRNTVPHLSSGIHSSTYERKPMQQAL